MQAANVKASGGIVFWSLATWSHQAKLEEKLTQLGFAAYSPKPMAPSAVLREAMEKVCGRRTENAWHSKRHLVRPLAEANSFCLVMEERGKTENRYPQVMYASVDPDTLTMQFDPYDDAAKEIVKEFHAHRGFVSGSQVGSSLVDLVKTLHGIPIRKTGGFYWLPASKFDAWQKIADTVEACPAYGTSQVYLGRLDVDAGSIRVVRDAIKAEIVAESQRVLDEVMEGKLGEKGLKNRVEYLDQLEAKVKEYEEIVGESLDDLRGSITTCATAIGMAAFQATQPEKVTA